MESFDNEFVAVHKQRIVDHDKEMSHLRKRVETKYPPAQVFVEFVSREKLTMVLRGFQNTSTEDFSLQPPQSQSPSSRRA